MIWLLLTFSSAVFSFHILFFPQLLIFLSLSASFCVFTVIIYPTALVRIIKLRQNRSWRRNNSKLICCLCPPKRFADKEAITFLHNNNVSFFHALSRPTPCFDYLKFFCLLYFSDKDWICHNGHIHMLHYSFWQNKCMFLKFRPDTIAIHRSFHLMQWSA